MHEGEVLNAKSHYLCTCAKCRSLGVMTDDQQECVTLKLLLTTARAFSTLCKILKWLAHEQETFE